MGPESIRRWLYLVILGLALVCAEIEEGDTRIVGGNEVSIAKTQYIVQILFDGSFICGGTLVKRGFVVTAAHCMEGRHKATRFSVKGGVSTLSASGVVRQVLRYKIPKGYNSNTVNMDVAVLQLQSPLSGSNIKPLALCKSPPPVGAAVRVSGWGARSTNDDGSNSLRFVNVNIISKERCVSEYKPRTLTGSMMCASKPDKTPCFGDSGGPLVYRNKLCGIVSWGEDCDSVFPSVYTATTFAKVKTFINRTIALFN